MKGGGFAAGADHGGVGGEDELRTVGNGLFEHGLVVPEVPQIGLYGDLGTELILEILPPLIMGLNPGAVLGRSVIEESDVQVVRAGDADDLGNDVLSFISGLGAEFDGGVVRLGQHVRPQGIDPF